MKIFTTLAAAFIATSAVADGHLPDLEGLEIVVVTENAYPPLQFIDGQTHESLGLSGQESFTIRGINDDVQTCPADRDNQRQRKE